MNYIDSQVTVIEKLRKEGYQSDFLRQDNGLKSLSTGNIYQPADMVIKATYRFEGESNPSDMSILYAVECNKGEKGLISDSYGADMDWELEEFIRKIPREKS
ncbi:MAG: hypothetical protein ACOCUL_01585 [Bacteroidota bacterium]